MEDNMKIINDFLNQFEDFTAGDKENGYVKVYRPERHPNPVQFWFNPPFGDADVSRPTPSATIILTNDGTIMVENYATGLFFNLNECLGKSVENFAFAIKEHYREEAL